MKTRNNIIKIIAISFDVPLTKNNFQKTQLLYYLFQLIVYLNVVIRNFIFRRYTKQYSANAK